MDKFEEPTKRILSCDSLRTIQDKRNLIDQNLLEESTKFLTPILQSGKFMETNKFEFTEEIDIRVKRLNKLDGLLKNLKKKHVKPTATYCESHQKELPTESSVSVNTFLEKDFSPTDVESLIKKDADVVQQHATNLEKMKKFMLVTEGCNVDEPNLPASVIVRDSVTLIREVNRNCVKIIV